MPLPFDIYMQPPNLLVLPLYSGWDLFSANSQSSWAEIVQINRDTLAYNVGDVVFYNQTDQSAIYSATDGLYYNVIDEGKVLFVEAPIPPPP